MSATSATISKPEGASDKVGLRLAGTWDQLATLEEESSGFLDECQRRTTVHQQQIQTKTFVLKNDFRSGYEKLEDQSNEFKPNELKPNGPSQSQPNGSSPSQPNGPNPSDCESRGDGEVEEQRTTTYTSEGRTCQNNDRRNRQNYDRRLSVFLGTNKPFERRRTQEEQEIDKNFQWFMCLRHRYTIYFFVTIVIFVVGMTISFLLKHWDHIT